MDGNENQESKLTSFYQKYKIYIFAGLAVLLLIAIAAGVMLYIQPTKKTANSDVLAIINGQKITVTDLKNSINAADPLANYGNASSDTKAVFLNEAIEKKILDANAQRLGINVSESDVSARIKIDGVDLSTMSQDQQNLVKTGTRYKILKERTQDKVLSWSAGDYLRVRFDRHFTEINGGTDAQRQQDRTYAENLANSLYTQLTTGKITMAQAQQMAQNDKTIDVQTYKGTWGNQYGSFNKTTFSEKFLREKEISAVASTQKGTYSKPFAGQIPLNNGSNVDGFFWIVKVSDSYKGEAYTYNKWLADQKAKLTDKGSLSLLAQKAYATPYVVNQGVYAQFLGIDNYYHNIPDFQARIYTTHSLANWTQGSGIYDSSYVQAGNYGSYITINGSNGAKTTSPNDQFAADCSFNDFSIYIYMKNTDLPGIYNGAPNPLGGYKTGVNFTNVGPDSDIAMTNQGNGLWKSTNPVTVTNGEYGTVHIYWKPTYRTLTSTVHTFDAGKNAYVVSNWGGTITGGTVASTSGGITKSCTTTAICSMNTVSGATISKVSLNPNTNYKLISYALNGTKYNVNSATALVISVNGNVTSLDAYFAKEEAVISKTPSCQVSVNPSKGVSPLVIKITTAIQNIDAALAKFTYTFFDGTKTTTITDKPALIYYSLNSPGTWKISATEQTTNTNCTPNQTEVEVTGTTQSGGGEVAP